LRTRRLEIHFDVFGTVTVAKKRMRERGDIGKYKESFARRLEHVDGDFRVLRHQFRRLTGICTFATLKPLI